MSSVQAFLLKFDESGITLWDQYQKHHLQALNQSVCVQGGPKIGQKFRPFSDQIFCNDHTDIKMKSLFGWQRSANVSLGKFEGRSNLNDTAWSGLLFSYFSTFSKCFPLFCMDGNFVEKDMDNLGTNCFCVFVSQLFDLFNM